MSRKANKTGVVMDDVVACPKHLDPKQASLFITSPKKQLNAK